MATQEKVRKRKARREPIVEKQEKVDSEGEGSQVSVREATDENMKDNTTQDKARESSPSKDEYSSKERDKTRKRSKDRNKSQPKDGITAPESKSQSQLETPKSKKKKDHVEQMLHNSDKEDRPRTPALFRKNIVKPVNGAKGDMGSDVSLRSNVSFSSTKEAWVERSQNGKEEDEDEDSPLKHAYIPYLYAKKCIAKIMEDMKSMKSNHIVIVHEIQLQYKEIEKETQNQFNKFVLCLRGEYSGKVGTFRQVIDIHREELKRKENYWKEMLESLAERNNRLLKEKKVLLIQNKTEIERLEKEKAELQTAVVAAVKPEVLVKLEEEKKILADQLENEKSEVKKLKDSLSSAKTSSTVIENKVNVQASSSSSGGGLAVVAGVMGAAVGLSASDRQTMVKERQEMEEERKKLEEERQNFEAERQAFENERKGWLNQYNDLQTQFTTLTMESAEWKVKYEIMKKQLKEAAGIKDKYHILENQYAALAAVATASEHYKQAAQEKLQHTHTEKVDMENELHTIETQIITWETSFKKKNGRAPTEADKSDQVKEMYTQKEECSYMVNKLGIQEETYQKMASGKVPDPPEVSPEPIIIKDPQVQTIQVKVSDPAIVAKLEQAQDEMSKLKSESTHLKEEMSRLKSEISGKNSEIMTFRARMPETEGGKMEISTPVKAALFVGAVTSSAASNEELEALKKENRSMKKDMKKMLKQYERLKENQELAGIAPDEHVAELQEQITVLDSKVADLDSECEAQRQEKLQLLEQNKGAVLLLTQLDEKSNQLIEAENKVSDLEKELAKLKEENREMHKDIKKMYKTHEKMKKKLASMSASEKAQQLLEIVAQMVHEIHSQVPDAAESVNTRLKAADADLASIKQDREQTQKAYEAWEDKYQTNNGNAPKKSDRDAEAEQLYQAKETIKKLYQEKMLRVLALELMKTGNVQQVVESRSGVKEDVEVKNLEIQLASLDNKVIDVESENNSLKDDKDRLNAKIQELEKTNEELKMQVELQTALNADTESSAELTKQIRELEQKHAGLEAALMQEKISHVNTREELENLHKQIEIMKQEFENEKKSIQATILSSQQTTEVEVQIIEEEVKTLKKRNETLETERLSKMPPDTANEIRQLQEKVKELEQQKNASTTSSVGLQAKVTELTTKLESTSKNLESQRAVNRELEAKLKSQRQDKDADVKKMSRHLEEAEKKRASDDKQRINMLVKRVKDLEAAAGKGVTARIGAGGGKDDSALKNQVMTLKQENSVLQTRIKQLEVDVRGGRPGTAAGGADRPQNKRQEKILKELEKKLEMTTQRKDKLQEDLKAAEDEINKLKKEFDEREKTIQKLQAELREISIAAKEGVEAAMKVKSLETDNKKLVEENKTLTKNFESERVLRKKYYNMVEDMKGKIRVYCRARPLSKTEVERKNHSVVRSADEYSICVETERGPKEFQFDQVFMEDSSQEKIFEDTNNLIQSAIDGYNVCIFAYGQTGSGKTFTMIGDRELKYPGIAPRAFSRIFELADELRSKFQIKVSAYMMELYNEKLIDLFAQPGNYDDEKLEIKKDKKGMVYVQGSVIKDASNSKELYALFDEGSKNRHTASTKMNAESSRSHLIIGILIESTNSITGQVLTGKLSLVDLAGSERVGKTGAAAQQLKEAMSINKSLSALGDVISALSSDQQFIPYRNNKLTMLMQDSLGGNAKTLMFVNISPADYNMDETVISLTYASRVKLITNDASKNADNKEIAKLKAIIAKLKQGEHVADEEI
ncbi:hypothetical protein CHS0354_009292 [Potamilus streckersoni]|uniref:Kinesin motor domain-containing protein n=1 Tax=Potamilus streckersoni TaxID=2493646 RepID=A0AAE0W7U2_9BIVA|nr:hypothetical protein CHS0354_009292 [Potamilus streckersoni]